MNSKKGYRYRLKLSENMKKQDYSEYDEMSFPTYNEAYYLVCDIWGSGILGTPLGLKIQMAKSGTDKWEDCR